MQYSRLGDSGLVVSRMALGAMTFGSAEGAMGAVYKVDQPLANQLVGEALDAGINFFNTADAYSGGDSERMLAEALGARRRDVAIATKVGFRTGEALVHQGLSRHHILASLEGSLQRLRTDYIDVYLVHRLDPFTPLEETLETLDDVVRQGKARYVGFSNWPAWLAAKSVGLQMGRGWSRFRAAELYYSLVGRDVEHELAPLLTDSGIGMLVWSPLAGGFLTGRYTKENPGGDGGRLAGFNVIPFDREAGYGLVESMRPMAAAHGTTVAAVALAWLLSKKVVASVLVGASKLSQLRDKLQAASRELSPAEVEELDRLTQRAAIYPNWFNRDITDEAVRKALG